MIRRGYPFDRSPAVSPWIWCFTLYFMEGFPFALIRSLSPYYFRTQGISLGMIGLTSLFALPWTLKFLWGPLVDSYGTKRNWILGMQAPLSVLFLSAAFVSVLPYASRWIWLLFFFGSWMAATHDIAIDGYYLASLDAKSQERFLGYRVMAFRLSMLFSSGVILTVSTHSRWSWGFGIAGALMILLYLFHFFFLPEKESSIRKISQWLRKTAKRPALHYSLAAAASATVLLILFPSWRQFLTTQLNPKTLTEILALLLLILLIGIGRFRKPIENRLHRAPDHTYAKAFLSFIQQPGIESILAFIILVRAGEWAMSNMVPTFIVDLGLKKEAGWISALVSTPCAILGAISGGWLISRWGMKRLIWPFLLLQNLTNLIYMFAAFRLSGYLIRNTGAAETIPLKPMEFIGIAAIQGFDQFAGGLGNAILIIYLMRLCKPDFKAAHYAIGSALMSLTGVFAAAASGFITDRIGYGWFFGLSFLFSIPGMLLAFFIPKE